MNTGVVKRWLLSSFWLMCLLVPATGMAAVGLPDFTGVVETHSAAVVNISTTQKVSSRDFGHGFSMPDMPESEQFNEFLKKFFGQHPELEGREPPDGDDEDERSESNSLGSGFIISADGYVVTNHHVVAEADEIIVRMSNRHEYVAELVGSDPRSDVALLKVEAKQELPILKLGSAEKLKVGEWVLAIGSPFNFDHSVTAGIVSAKGRSLPSEQYVPFLQTDVAINPGNSGGPLFNLDGEVVGINSQIYSRTGGFMGLSFAIPIEVAMEVVEQLKSNGKVTRGWLGVYIQEITSELAESFGMQRPRGALVAQVIAESPAEKAGVQVGDVLLSFNKHKISHSADLPPLVGRVPVGDEAVLALLRDGKDLKLDVTIEALPEDDQLEARRRSSGMNRQARLGIVIGPLDDEAREQLNVTEGVMVQDVLAGPARSAGLRPGDVIVSIDNKKVSSIEKLNELVKALPANRSVPLLIQREGGPVFLPLKLEE